MTLFIVLYFMRRNSGLYDACRVVAEKHILPQTDIKFILCLILSALTPHSKFVEMLKPKHAEQTQFGIHIPHHVQSHHHHQQNQPSPLLRRLALLGMHSHNPGSSSIMLCFGICYVLNPDNTTYHL